MTALSSDFLVIGAGIAGAAAAHFLGEHGDVTILEAESSAGRHSTGRSAALFSEYYGGPVVRTMTSLSRDFYRGFAGLLRPRGVLALAPADAEAEFEAALRLGSTVPQGVQELTTAQARRLYPVLRTGTPLRLLLRPGACDIDVSGAHRQFLRHKRLVTDAVVTELRYGLGRWRATTPVGQFEAPVVVNAAGAWADEVAALAGVPKIGLVSRRRTIALVHLPDGCRPAAMDSWPMLTDIAGTFYAKPESSGLALSPMDSEAAAPGSPVVNELDVATAIARFEAVTTIRIRHVRRSWVGLRSSVADDVPVIGAAAPGFYWLAALGGYGIQLAPAAGQLLATLVTGEGPSGRDDIVAAVRPGRLVGAMSE